MHLHLEPDNERAPDPGRDSEGGSGDRGDHQEPLQGASPEAQLHRKYLSPFFSRAQGHLSQSDLVKVIDEIDPDKIIPIHTTNKQWFKEHFDNAAEVENGQVLAL